MTVYTLKTLQLTERKPKTASDDTVHRLETTTDDDVLRLLQTT